MKKMQLVCDNAQLLYTHKRMLKDIRTILKEISNSWYDTIVYLPRGGMIPAAYISYHLGVQHVVDFNAFVRELTDPSFVRGSIRALLVDDISDSGATLERSITTFNNAKIVGDVMDTATLIKRRTTRVHPTYFGTLVTGKQWVMFPWDQPL